MSHSESQPASHSDAQPPSHAASHSAARSIGDNARLACILEVTAPKAGNVHPAARFADVTHEDFITSARAIAPILDRAASQSVGATILDCVTATRAAVGVNTNLGIILLLAPLCAVPADVPLAAGVAVVLSRLTVDDAALAFEAIRRAKPGGLGDAAEQDVQSPPTVTLLEAMRLAADRDAIARQYANGFHDVIHTIADDLVSETAGAASTSLPLSERIVRAHLRQMAREPDTLIARKCGAAVAREAANRARQVLDARWPATTESASMFASFDAWLRGDGHRRNPGTSADLIAAALFVVLRDGRVEPE